MFSYNYGPSSRKSSRSKGTTGCGKFMLLFYVLALIGYVLYSTGKLDALSQKISSFVREAFVQRAKSENDKINEEIDKRIAVKTSFRRAEHIHIDSNIYDVKFLGMYRRPLDDDFVNESLQKAAKNQITQDTNPVQVLAAYNRPFALVKLGIALPELINAQDSNGICPMAEALIKGAERSVKALLMFPGIDLTLVDKNNFTILHHAAKSGNAEVIKRALQQGASPYAKTIHGLTPRNLVDKDNYHLLNILSGNF